MDPRGSRGVSCGLRECGGLARQAAASGELPTVNAAEAAPEDLEGQTILLQGPLRVPSITDPLTGVTVSSGALNRVAEMYRWEERTRVTDVRDGSIEYYYVKDWNERLIDSSEFALTSFGRYKNPDAMAIGPSLFTADWIGLGVLLCLKPSAELFHVAPGFTNAPFPRRPLISVAAAVGVAGLVGVWVGA